MTPSPAELEQELEELRRRSARRADFVAQVAHDLRTPLSAVIGSAVCVQYERHFVASRTPGSSSAPVGQASMQRVHEPQPGSTGAVGSSSTVVTSVPSTIQEPWRRVSTIVFLP